MKNNQPEPKPKIYSMSFAKVYPLLVAKAERKGRSKVEVDEIIFWLTGYDKTSLNEQIKSEVDCEAFFKNAPQLNPGRKLITGVICGVRVEEIKQPIMQEIRYLDKLIDELVKNKPLIKILAW